MLARHFRNAITAASLPVQWIATGIAKVIPHNPKWTKVVLGLGFIYLGSFIATHIHVPEPWHIHQDALAYFLHGLGSAPIIGLLIGE